MSRVPEVKFSFPFSIQELIFNDILLNLRRETWELQFR